MHKNSLLSVFAFSALLLGATSCNHTSSNHTSQMPSGVQNFLETYFPGREVTDFQETKNMMDYEVKMDDGTEIEFNSLGEWEEMDFKNSEMSQEFAKTLPSSIFEYIQQYYSNGSIRKVEKIPFGRRSFFYRIVLHKPNNVELRFTNDGDVISDRPEANRLPSLAQNFLEKHFLRADEEMPTEVIAIVKDEDNEYDVTLSDKTAIHFDRRGNWTEIKGAKKKDLPASFQETLPSSLTRYIATNYEGQIIRKVEKKSFGYRVRLNKPNNVELSFNDNGMFLSKQAKDTDDEEKPVTE